MVKKIFEMIGSLIEKKPFKTLLLTLLIVAVMIAGASQIRMATGNETLVKNNNPAYVSNQTMEDTFGGDSILILFQAHNEIDLLSLKNITKMYDIEQKFSYEENIFSFISPATIVHQITNNQSKEIISQLETISSGLSEMGSKMSDLGVELNAKKIKDPKEILAKLNELSKMTDVFGQLITAQNNLTAGVKQMETGLNGVADGLATVSSQLTALAQAQPVGILKTTLNTIANNLTNTSNGVRSMGTNTQSIQAGTSSTANALTNISGNLHSELSSMKDGLDSGLSPEQLKTMADGFIQMGENLTNISKGLMVFHTKSSMMVSSIPTLDSELEFILYDENQTLRSIFSDVVIDKNHAMMVIKLKGNLPDSEKDRITSDISSYIEKVQFENITYTMSGKPVLDNALRTEMKANMMIMVALAILIMFAVLLLVFKVRWRMLSLGVIFVCVIATLGFMGWINVPVTMVSMAVFPILIGLGIDYSIQFHNRYAEEKSVINTIKNIGKAVAIAVFATVLGFISLYASPVPMIQDFGKMLTLGVIISFLGSIFILLPILQIGKINDNYSMKIEKSDTKASIKNSFLDRIFVRSTKMMIKLTIPILLLFVLMAGAGFSVDRFVGVETDIEKFMPQDLEALEDIHTIRDAVGTTDQMVIYLTANDVLSEENLNWIEDETNNILANYGDSVLSVKSISTLLSTLNNGKDVTHDESLVLMENLPKTQRGMFVSEDNKETILILNTKHLATEETKVLIENITSELKDSPMSVEITGKSVIDVEMVEGLTSGRITMTLLGLLLVFAALLLIYRNVMKAIIPIIPVVMIIGISSGVMYLMGIDFTPITATLGALVLGMGTEMTVMLMERYIEERRSGKEKTDAMVVAVSKIGKAIVASGLTTVGGFSVLMFSSFIILKDFGFMTVINISLALLSTFVVLPPMIVLFDQFIIPKAKKVVIDQ